MNKEIMDYEYCLIKKFNEILQEFKNKGYKIVTLLEKHEFHCKENSKTIIGYKKRNVTIEHNGNYYYIECYKLGSCDYYLHEITTYIKVSEDELILANSGKGFDDIKNVIDYIDNDIKYTKPLEYEEPKKIYQFGYME